MYRVICLVLVATLSVAGCTTKPTDESRCTRSAPVAAPAAARHSAENRFYGAGLAGPLPNEPVLSDDADQRIVLPSTLYMVVGQTYRLDYADIISGFDPAAEVVETHPQAGDPAVYWAYTPDKAESFTLSITVRDAEGTPTASASRPVTVLAPATGHDLRHLSIGDSITRAGGYVELAVQCVLGGRSVGTRTYDGGIVNEEGRGGWTLAGYESRIAEPSGGDSPFLFPVGVAGAKFLGNTSFWRDVVEGSPRGYDYDGFQMIARGWRSNSPYSYDSSGYPRSPAEGDVVVDPTMPAGEQWRKYSGTMWVPMNPQPSVELSFSKYIERFAPAFTSGRPTSISVMLGTVDFLSTLTDESWSAYESGMDTFIASIRAWNPSVPVVLIGSPTGGPTAMWADQKVTGPDFSARILDHNRRLIAAYDTAAEREKGVYVISFLGVVSEGNMADYVHPRMPEGHSQMSPWLAGVLAYLMAEGKT